MSREFTLHLLQKDLQTQNERWLKLKLTSPRVVSPFANLLAREASLALYYASGLLSPVGLVVSRPKQRDRGSRRQ